MTKPFSIRLNEKEEKDLNRIMNLLGLSSKGQALKCCIPWAIQRLEMFKKEYLNVIRPLKLSEIDILTTTLKIWAKEIKKEKHKENLQNSR